MSRNSHRQGAISLVKLILSCLCPMSLFSRGRERFFQDTERCGWLGDCLARVFEEIRNVLRRHWEKRKVLQVASEVPLLPGPPESYEEGRFLLPASPLSSFPRERKLQGSSKKTAFEKGLAFSVPGGRQ